MEFKIDIINIFILIVMLVNSIYGLFIYSRNRRDKVNFTFFIITISISSWGLTMFGYRGFLDHDIVLWMARLLYFTATTIPTAFVYFCYIFPDPNAKLNLRQKYLTPIPMLSLCLMSLIPGWFIYDVTLYSYKESFIVFNIFSHILFGIYVVTYFIWSYWIIYKKYRKALGILKIQLAYIFFGTFISTFITLITNLALLYFGDFDFNWVGQIGVVVMITLIFYSILKYRLFNIKVIATELLIFSLWIFISIRIFLATSIHEILIECCILLFTIVIGLITIRGTLKEITHREEIEILASDLKSLNSTLSQKVAEQTAEVRKAYELEKHARRDLEKLNETKDQFIMITQHHLRTPVTSIRWELESMLNGTYGRVGAMLKQALNDTNTSVARLTRIVDDFLNITALKVGSQILNIEPGNLEPLVLDVLHELKIDIENMKLSVDCPKDRASWPDLEIDAGKMREVLLIILENAVKYNVDHGTIQIKTRLLEDPASRMFEMSIENTGIGLVSEDREKLFSRHFFRSKRAQAANPIGMGIGLSVARAVVRAHHGDLAIESAGENMGAKVMLKLPL